MSPLSRYAQITLAATYIPFCSVLVLAQDINFYHAKIHIPIQNGKRFVPLPLSLHEISDSCSNDVKGRPEIFFKDKPTDTIHIRCAFAPFAKEVHTLTTVYSFDPNGNGDAVYFVGFFADDNERGMTTNPDALAKFMLEIGKNAQK